MKFVMTVLVALGSYAHANAVKSVQDLIKIKRGHFFTQCLNTASGLMAAKENADQFLQKYQAPAAKYCQAQSLKQSDEHWKTTEHPAFEGCSLAVNEFSPKGFTAKQINFGIDQFCKNARAEDANLVFAYVK